MAERALMKAVNRLNRESKNKQRIANEKDLAQKEA
jgi:hypothetical protein